MNNSNYLDYHLEDEELSIMYLNIPEDMRRKNYATKLIKELINKHKHEIKYVNIPSDASKIALSFWLSLGFEYIDEDEKMRAKVVFSSSDKEDKIHDIDDNAVVQMIKKL